MSMKLNSKSVSAQLQEYLNNEIYIGCRGESDLFLLLESLRWRITKFERDEQNISVAKDYIKNDILDMKSSNIVFDLLKHENSQIIESFVRFLNELSSFASGRKYLMKIAIEHTKMICILCEIFTTTDCDNLLRMNCLGVLQKLSFKQECQDIMIAEGLFGFIISLLNDEMMDLSRYTVEYATALLMNLSLRIRMLRVNLNEKHVDKIFETLFKLLNSSFVADIYTYCNGVIYSLLSLPNIQQIVACKSCKADLIKQQLNKCLKEYSDPCFKQQIDYIISQLTNI